MVYQNRKTTTHTVPSTNTTALKKDRFVDLGAGGLQYAAEDGDSIGILLDDVPANTEKTVSVLSIDGNTLGEVEPVDSVAFAIGDQVAVSDTEGKAKKAASGTSVSLGKVEVARSANSNKILSFWMGRKGGTA